MLSHRGQMMVGHWANHWFFMICKCPLLFLSNQGATRPSVLVCTFSLYLLIFQIILLFKLNFEINLGQSTRDELSEVLAKALANDYRQSIIYRFQEWSHHGYGSSTCHAVRTVGWIKKETNLPPFLEYMLLNLRVKDCYNILPPNEVMEEIKHDDHKRSSRRGPPALVIRCIRLPCVRTVH